MVETISMFMNFFVQRFRQQKQVSLTKAYEKKFKQKHKVNIKKCKLEIILKQSNIDKHANKTV